VLDYKSVREKKITFNDLVEDLSFADLRREINEMIDEIQRLIVDCEDADVIFQPVDPKADDQFAAAGEAKLAWTLGHVIAHCTASAEESAFLAAELARGVEFHGRSRWEVPWRTVTTIAQCRARLKESRRMRLASLDLWPIQPHLNNTYIPWAGAQPMNAISRFASGLIHDYDHLGHIAEIVKQAQAARKNR
jgi:hypothetical protein